MQIMNLMVEIKGRRMAARTLAFAEKQLFTPTLTRSGLGPVQAACYRIEFRRGRKVKHVLELRHVAHTDAIQNNHALLRPRELDRR